MCALPADLPKIVILRALQLGDMLNAVPAFRALRAAYPSSKIALVGLPWQEEFVRRFHSYLDEFILFPGVPGFPEQPADLARFPAFLSLIQARRFDLAIQMQGSGDIANTIVSLWGAKQNAGFFLPGQYCPDEHTFMEYPDHEPEAWRHLRLMEFLGIPSKGDDLEFPIFKDDWDEFDQIRKIFGLNEKYVCIHPGARKSDRRWPVENFAGVADGLAALGLQIVLTGSASEAHLASAVSGNMRMPAVDLAGRTSPGCLAALISKARLLISNDTGVSHVATAVKAPSIILFTASDLDRWAPTDRQLHRVLWPASRMSTGDVLTEATNYLGEMNVIIPVTGRKPGGRW